MSRFFPSQQYLISPLELALEFPISSEIASHVNQSRKEIIEILEGRDPRILMIIGPCSIHSYDGALVYAKLFKELAKTVKDRIFLVMRAYCEKPRSIFGWKGLMYDPDLDGSHDINKGIRLSRQLFIELGQQGIPIATEFLDPASPIFFEDLISWGCIGARTVSSQVHRQIASGLPMPVGIKNDIHGSIETAIHGILSAKQAHAFFGLNHEGRVAQIQTQGNPHSHLVLRGGYNGPNYSYASIQESSERLTEVQLKARCIIDCSHGNSQDHYYAQSDVFHYVIHQILEGANEVRGIQLESYLEAGKQEMKGSLHPHISITDACLDWISTEELVKGAYKKLADIYTLASHCSGL